ncbi:hypothetical protein AZE42_06568 [Rhizopogon vesiculosus]|uniref:Uncharacterized protein n=1 Tax=Rhizopogon vesiculosus TaxID=180088 RepID=A0A1J8QYM9_9AGAM|nr:hypothetical protein AZE42_06568 [Rhizopogon vesiculosus]
MCRRIIKVHQCPSCQKKILINYQSLEELKTKATTADQAYFLEDWEDCLSFRCSFSLRHHDHKSDICTLTCKQTPETSSILSDRSYYCARCRARG